MEYSSTQDGTTLSLSFRGDLGFSDNPKVQDIIMVMADSDSTLYSIDLSELKNIDSAGLGMFIILNEAVKKNGKKFELRRPFGQVLKMLEISKFSDIISIRS